MNNLTRPASPQPIAFHPESPDPQTSWGVHEDFAGFTKLEIAALMIAQGLVADPNVSGSTLNTVPEMAVKLAQAILEEANK